MIGATEAEIGDHGVRQGQGLDRSAIRRDLGDATVDEGRLTNPSLAVDCHRVEQRVARCTVEQPPRVKRAVRMGGDLAGTIEVPIPDPPDLGLGDIETAPVGREGNAVRAVEWKVFSVMLDPSGWA
jgi:hypothetical protein